MINTRRLLLRRADRGDLQDLHQVFAHPAAMRYWDSLPHQQLAQTAELLNAMIEASPSHSADFVIECKGRAIGKAGCWRPWEIGFILHPDFWGKGLAHEALCAIIPHVFQTLPADRLTADVDPRNSASLKLLSRLRFEETGRAKHTIRVGSEWCDSVYLELRRPL